MYQHVMVCLDGSELAECVLPHAAKISTDCNVPKITFIWVIKPLKLYGSAESHISPEERERLEADSMEVAAAYLEEKARPFRDQNFLVECAVLFGNVVDQIIDYTEKNGVNLIIIATHGRSGVSRLFLGSVADRILQASPVPILMVRVPDSEARATQ